MPLLILAGFAGELLAFAILLPYGLLVAIFGAILGSTVCMGLAGACLFHRGPEWQSNGAGAQNKVPTEDEYSMCNTAVHAEVMASAVSFHCVSRADPAVEEYTAYTSIEPARVPKRSRSGYGEFKRKVGAIRL